MSGCRDHRQILWSLSILLVATVFAIWERIMRKIKTGDDVVVLTGKDRGKRGTVLRVPDADHVVVENLNMVKKHQRANPQRAIEGGIVDKEMPLHISNVGVFNPAKGRADRIGFKVLDDGRKVRVFKSDGEVVDV
jgi:large subunit ribosomal protein L24